MPILQDKVVLVTGAGAGIGRATSLAMAEAGANVASADIDLTAAQRTADQIATNTRRGLAIEVDCGDVAKIDAMVARTVAEFGRRDLDRAIAAGFFARRNPRGDLWRVGLVSEVRRLKLDDINDHDTAKVVQNVQSINRREMNKRGCVWQYNSGLDALVAHGPQ